MRIAFVSDVHGNLPALEACLDLVDARGFDRLVSLGDMFGYFPDGIECHARLVDAGAELMLGNHEAMLLGLLPIPSGHEDVVKLAPERARLTPELRSELAGLRPFMEIVVEKCRLLLVHGTPVDPLRGYAYPDSDLSQYVTRAYDHVVMGNTHRAMLRTLGGTTFVNIGSVGLPRDGGDSGSFGSFDTSSAEFEVIRFPLDRQVIKTRYPNVHRDVVEVLDR